MTSHDTSDLFDRRYFEACCGTPYVRNEHWTSFFGHLANRIVASLAPRTVLDAGCAMGFLVEALRDRGVEAWGLDISEYAISRVRDDVRPFCHLASLTEPIEGRYDLIVCIEVLEHLPPADAQRGVMNMCAATDDVLLSTTPHDFSEATHVNVQPPSYWSALFAQSGFYHDLEYDASFITPWATRFRRARLGPGELVSGYERKLWTVSEEVRVLRERLIRLQWGSGTDGPETSAQQMPSNRTPDVVDTSNAGILQKLDAQACLLQELLKDRETALDEAAAESRALRAVTETLQTITRDFQEDTLGRQHAQVMEALEASAAAAERLTQHVSSLEDVVAEQSASLLQMQAERDDAVRKGEQLAEQVAALTGASAESAYLQTRLALIEHRKSFKALQALWNVKARLDGSARAARRAERAVAVDRRGVGADLHEDSYMEWVARSERLRFAPEQVEYALSSLTSRPTISILMPTYNTPPAYLRAAIDSVLAQYYPEWELCIVDDASTSAEVRAVLEEYAAIDARIRVDFSPENQGIGGATQRALDMARGGYVGLLDHDDLLSPDALLEMATAAQGDEFDLIYSDEDKIRDDGTRFDPFFKPAWSPDLLLAMMYTSHFSVYRRDLVEKVGGFRAEFSGSQDYDLALRVTEQTSRIAHVPRVLYHWRTAPGSTSAEVGSKSYAITAAERALTEALARREIQGEVEIHHLSGLYRVRRAIVRPGKVSIIIPTRDAFSYLHRCVDSIEAFTDYPDYEIVIVDNGSTNPTVLEYLENTPRRVIRDQGKFNYSRINNDAVHATSGEYVLFLNNDTEVLSPGWLTAMVEHGQRPEVGAVGAKLLYPDGRIQHAGVVMGIGGVAGHASKYQDDAEPGYFYLPNAIRDFSAVTAACMLVRRSVFEEVGGFNEGDLAVSFNDVDLCLRLMQRGYRIVYTPFARLYHFESASRPKRDDPREIDYMLAHWRPGHGTDPFYNPNLTLDFEDFRTDYFKPEGTRVMFRELRAHGVTGSFRQDGPVWQEVWCTYGDFCGVSVRVATFGRSCRGTLTLTVSASDRERTVLRTVTIDAADIEDNAWRHFFFAPLRSTKGRGYVIAFSFAPSDATSDITLWQSDSADPVMGPFRNDRGIGSGTLTMELFQYAAHPRQSGLRSSL